MDGVVGIVGKTAVGPLEIAGTAGNGTGHRKIFFQLDRFYLSFTLATKRATRKPLESWPPALGQALEKCATFPLRTGPLEGSGAVAAT